MIKRNLGAEWAAEVAKDVALFVIGEWEKKCAALESQLAAEKARADRLQADWDELLCEECDEHPLSASVIELRKEKARADEADSAMAQLKAHPDSKLHGVSDYYFRLGYETGRMDDEEIYEPRIATPTARIIELEAENERLTQQRWRIIAGFNTYQLEQHELDCDERDHEVAIFDAIANIIFASHPSRSEP
jgi:hypothetical protein